MTPGDVTLVASAGLVAGAVNAIAGGGTLVTFPALLATGMNAVTANITSSVGLLSGYAGGSVGYRRELSDQRPRIRALGVVLVLGAAIGAVLLLATPASAFRAVVPYLILTSCALLASQPRLSRAVAARRTAQGDHSAAGRRGHDISWAIQIGVLVGAVYGSYFGAGLGVLLLGVLGVLLDDELQRLNALKGLMSLIINATGVLVFIVSGSVAWVYAGVLAGTAYVGGLLGVAAARRLPAQVLRAAVVAFGVAVALALIVRR